MRVLRIIEPGLFSTVQDLGRPGCASLGVPRGGAADTVALRLGNRVVGNQDDAAAIEMTLTGLACVFESDGLVAIAGAKVRAAIETGVGGSRVCRPGFPEEILAGQTLRIGRFDLGCRAYLCVAGGIVVPRRLGSASTLAGAGFGGLEGRAIRTDDRLAFGTPSGRRRPLGTDELALGEEILTRRVLRATPGPPSDHVPRRIAEPFWTSSFTVSEQSDRVGVRLEGRTDAVAVDGRMISEGMMPGAVQVTGDGRPIVLMCDHPTTGGYPVVACVASVDLPVVGQLRPREPVSFEAVSLEAAWALFNEREARLRRGGVE